MFTYKLPSEVIDKYNEPAVHPLHELAPRKLIPGAVNHRLPEPARSGMENNLVRSVGSVFFHDGVIAIPLTFRPLRRRKVTGMSGREALAVFRAEHDLHRGLLNPLSDDFFLLGEEHLVPRGLDDV